MNFPWTKPTQKLAAQVERLTAQMGHQNQALAKMFEVIENPTGASAHRWDNPWLYATPHSPKRHPKSLATLETLQQFANTYDILRSCINHLKREAQSVHFAIVSRDPNEHNPERIAEANEFFSRTGGLGGIRVRTRHFENQIFEDVLTVGAYAVYIRPTRGGRPYEAIAIDSTTIRPVVDLLGWQNPLEAYEQQIQGVPLRRFAMDELYYDGLDPVTNSPYFRSPVEYLLGVVMSALKADEWNRSWLTDGNTADSLISVPETWTPEQVLSYSAYFDAILAGNSSERVKTKIVPSGTKLIQSQTRKDADFQEFERWLMQRTCSIMGVQPASIGYPGDQYKVSQEGSMSATTRFGVGALLALRKELYDDLLDALGFSDLEVRNRPQGVEDPDQKASRLVQQVGGPYKTVNEARSEDGLCPLPGGDVLAGLSAPSEEGFDDEVPDDEPWTIGSLSDEDDDDELRLEDLRKWQRKALGKLKEGKSAQTPFESAAIPFETNEAIFEGLLRCLTFEEVADLFRGYQDQPRDARGRWIATTHGVDSGWSHLRGKERRQVPEKFIKTECAGLHINKPTGWEILVSSKVASKSTSGHLNDWQLHAVRNLVSILESAQLTESHADKRGIPNLERIHRFYTNLKVGNESRRVKLTVKEYVRPSDSGGKDRRLYHIQALDV